MYDIAIIGAGPAGATLARLLAGRYRVLLVDRRRLEQPASVPGSSKPCGGLLAPAAQHELARQGLGVPRHVLAGPALFAVRTIDLSSRMERLYQRFYVNIDRDAFDRWLVGLVPGEVDTLFGWSLNGIERSAEGSFLGFVTGKGGRASVRARLVIGADGASSVVRRIAFPGAPQPERYVAMQSEYESTGCEPNYGAVFDSSLTDFYGWTIPKEGRLIAGIALPLGAEVMGSRGYVGMNDDFARKLRNVGFGLGRELRRSSAMIYRPTRRSHLCVGAGNILLAGEAAGLISPSSAEGISFALRSAAMLSSAVEKGLAGACDRYNAETRLLRLQLGAKVLKGRAIYTPGTRRMLMRSGLGAVIDIDGLPAPFLPSRAVVARTGMEG